MSAHPDIEAEQAYVDHAYQCIEDARERVLALRNMRAYGTGGTHQARYESDVVEETIRARLAQLEFGDIALVFGRIDEAETAERFYIGRIAVADEYQEPVVVDWRAPIAEPFYRATGRNPLGLSRRRHFATRGRQVLDIEDEIFVGGEGEEVGPDGVVGRGALIAALERGRTGRLGDIVATIQTEQDEIIRSELGGVLVVQGGPGTGKTVVALHRAAYLLTRTASRSRARVSSSWGRTASTSATSTACSPRSARRASSRRLWPTSCPRSSAIVAGTRWPTA